MYCDSTRSYKLSYSQFPAEAVSLFVFLYYPSRAAAIVRDNLEDIARLDVKDNGKPIWEAR